MSKKIALLLVMCLCLLVSCEKNKYKIVLTPQGDSIKREVTCWREGDNEKIQEFPQTQLNQITQAYSTPSQKAQAKKYTFARTFTDKMPNDIGGEGYYLHATTTMGDSFFYSERFRGNDDLQQGLNQRQQAVDELIDIIIGWFQSEMRWEWNFGKLKRFLDHDFRWDIQNICLYGWSASLTGQDKEMGFRSIQYLAERGYFDLREFLEAVNEFGYQEKYDKFLEIIRQLTARKMGYDIENLPKSLAFLSTEYSAKKSLEKYLSTSKQYKVLLKQWENQKKTNPDIDKPEPLDVMGNLFSQALGGEGLIFFPTEFDDLEVTLNCPIEPYETNGKWNPKKRTLEWSQGIEKSKSKLPTYLFAVWTVPNEVFQKTHFGQIVLEGEWLGGYTLWQGGLSSTQKKEWNAFLETLTPGPELKEKISAFEFKSSTKTEPADATRWKKHFDEVLSKKDVPASRPATKPTTQSNHQLR